MKTIYYPPAYEATGFNCPSCDVYSEQLWFQVAYGNEGHKGNSYHGFVKDLKISFCRKCCLFTIWLEEKMIFPIVSSAPMPSDDMPDDIKADYLEARSIINYSPRAACALLRLVMQKLMAHLGGKGKDLNKDIGMLVENGLPVKVQKALDSVRIIGNEAVHPGELDLKDDIETANKMFKLVNMVVEVMITQPKEVDAIYENLPNGKKEQIEKRDES